MLQVRSTNEVDYITQDDPALDKMSPAYDVEKWFGDCDRKHLPVRAGCIPTLWRLRRLSRKHYLAITSVESKSSQADLAIRYGLVGWSALKDAAGNDILCELTGEGIDKHQTEESLNRIFSPLLWIELNSVIHAIATLRPLADAP